MEDAAAADEIFTILMGDKGSADAVNSLNRTHGMCRTLDI